MIDRHRAEEAARNGNWKAAYSLWRSAASLRDKEKWRAIAEPLIRSAMADGDEKAKVVLSAIIQLEHPEEAERLAREAAENGDTVAMGLLAGYLAKRDPAAAQEWEDRAVAAGDANALYLRARRLEGADPSAARRYLWAAAEHKSPEAMAKVGYLLYKEGKDTEALSWYRRAAETGNAQAMTNVARILYPTNHKESVGWLGRAADAGDIKAMKLLASELQTADWLGTQGWLKRACDLGDDEACEMLRRLPARRPWIRLGLLRLVEPLGPWLYRKKRESEARKAKKGRSDHSVH